MRLTGDPAPGTMNSSGSGNFLLVPIPEYPLLDCVPNKTVKIVVLGASNVGKTGTGRNGGGLYRLNCEIRIQMNAGSFSRELKLI